MAIAGQRPKSAVLKLVTGNPGKREIPEVPEIEMRREPLVPPKKLSKAQQVLWDRFINTAWWLTDHDVPKAYMWVSLESEFEKAPTEMLSTRMAQLRVLGSELGLDPSSRTRMGAVGQKKQADPADRFFG